MTDIKDALTDFWAQFGIPAYLTDCVPDGAELPYITFNVTQGSLTGSAVLTAFNWHHRVISGNRDRTELMDRIAQAIPVGGRMLQLDQGGYVVLYRNDADFQTDWQDDMDTDVIGGRTSYIVNYYNL